MGIIDPKRRHYRRLGSGSRGDPHPADEVIGLMPDVVEADRLAADLSARLSSSEAGRRWGDLWVAYEDARLHQRSLREERFFDVGFEMGFLAGLHASQDGVHETTSAALRSQLQTMMASSDLSPERAAAVLLDVARALVTTRYDSPGASD